MTKVTLLLVFLVFAVTVSTFKARVVKICEYEMVVSTGRTRGPSDKLSVMLEAWHGEKISTSNVVKRWGTMSSNHTYFLAYSKDRFVTRVPCLERGFCGITIKGKKGELKPHWYLNNITVTTKGEGVPQNSRTFDFIVSNEIKFINPALFDGECP